MSLDLEFDDAQQAMAAAVAQFCRDQYDPLKAVSPSAPFSRVLWRELAALDVFGLAIPGGGGGAIEVAALMESLGRAAFPGPLAGTFLAVRLLPEPARMRVAKGDDLVCVGTPPLLSFAPMASHFIELDLAHEQAWLARPRGTIAAVETLAGEPWGRLELERDQELPDFAPALAFSEIAAAAYLAAAGQKLVDDAADHARTRRQFDRTIGEFQAVAHPLADCAIRLAAARGLARAASARFDAMESDAAGKRVSIDAAAARLSAVAAALAAAQVCTQVFGAMGVLREGPIFHVVRQIRQLASSAPGSAGARERMVESLGLGRQAA
ncbi:MAG TPA: acyl-CoA dehydrogenase family protein [Myxococcota bacterium]|nr:acyl-CoA dehydrogenase family protein [Myxococcota bacterium]